MLPDLVYFIESKANKIGKLDIFNSTFSEYQSSINSTTTAGGYVDIIFDGTLNQLYYVLNDTLTIGRLDTYTNTTTEWKIPSQNSDSKKNEILSLSSVYGDIFFVKSDSNKIGRLSPATNTITEWNIPTDASGPTDIFYDFGTSVYFLENKADKIGRYNYVQNFFTEWDISKSPNI